MRGRMLMGVLRWERTRRRRFWNPSLDLPQRCLDLSLLSRGMRCRVLHGPAEWCESGRTHTALMTTASSPIMSV
ncbi:hypothetical protein BXZ70DRAFT_1073654 [Cristinia sonorae]|uniref:Uncharacterized protein n=1 Tax=Cristinia sonorae TaxID=1940300 RepID=A0A8K0UEQ2_9AGAR|nr:hypothetical protein BXZ70DRAFT_1073654 [Cristinia sonorae]